MRSRPRAPISLERDGSIRSDFSTRERLLNIPMIHEPSGYAILHNINDAAVRPADDRFAVGHGLQKYEAESFAVAWQCKHIGVRVTREEFLLLQAIKKTGPM